MAGKKNMKKFFATFLNERDDTVTREEYMARNQVSAQRKANRKVKKYLKVLTVGELVEEKKGRSKKA